MLPSCVVAPRTLQYRCSGTEMVISPCQCWGEGAQTWGCSCPITITIKVNKSSALSKLAQPAPIPIPMCLLSRAGSWLWIQDCSCLWCISTNLVHLFHSTFLCKGKTGASGTSLAFLSLDLCSGCFQVFREQAIDGETLPLLTEEHLLNNMGLKLGPALKIRSQVGMVSIEQQAAHVHVVPSQERAVRTSCIEYNSLSNNCSFIYL